MQLLHTQSIAGSSPAITTNTLFAKLVRHRILIPTRGGSSPSGGAKLVCPGDGIGIRVGLRSQILRVRVSPWAPLIKL